MDKNCGRSQRASRWPVRLYRTRAETTNCFTDSLREADKPSLSLFILRVFNYYAGFSGGTWLNRGVLVNTKLNRMWKGAIVAQCVIRMLA